jgi:hypothetical protein
MSTRALASAAASLAIVACAANARQSSVTTGAAPAAAPEARPHSPQDDEIARLAEELDQQRRELALPAPTATTYGSPNVAPVPSDAHATIPAAECHRGTSETCTQACTLSTKICDNAQKICDIAKELPGDAWAEQKCSEGNQTCAAAKTRCCECAP